MHHRPAARIIAAAIIIAGTTALLRATEPAGAAGGNVIRRWAATMGGPQSLTLDQALADARNFDVIIGHPRTFGPYVARMRAAKPGLKFVYYLNGTFARPTEQNAFPESWFAHNAFGARVLSSKTRNHLMDLNNAGWADNRSGVCAHEAALAGWDGCYLDALGAGTLTDGYVTSDPINTATGRVWTMGELLTATSAIATRVRTDNPVLWVTGNGLGTGSQYFDPAWGPSSKLFRGIEAGNAQGFVRGATTPPGEFRPEGNWKLDVDMMRDASARGRTVLAMSKVWIPATRAQKDALHRYALATFLLGVGKEHYWYWSDDGEEGAFAQDHPYDHVVVGTPAGAMARQNNAYVRHFTAGVAVVNPTTRSVTVDLGANYKNLQGASARKVTLAPFSGNVYHH